MLLFTSKLGYVGPLPPRKGAPQASVWVASRARVVLRDCMRNFSAQSGEHFVDHQGGGSAAIAQLGERQTEDLARRPNG